MAREFSPLKQLDTPVKVLFTGYLTTVAVGYLVALIQILFTTAWLTASSVCR